MATTLRTPRVRHLRHGMKDLPVVNVRRRFLDIWLEGQITKFTGTATALTVASIDPTDTAYATGTLTFSDQPAVDETVTVGSTTYTFKSSVTTGANEVAIGESVASTAGNLSAAIDRDRTEEGTGYGSATVTNADASSEADGTGLILTITAKSIGEAGNTVALSSTASNITASGATLSGGADGNIIEITGHGLEDGEGPFILESTGTLPGNYSGEFLFVHVEDANNIKVYTTADAALLDDDGSEFDFSDAGTGTITFVPDISKQGLIEHIRGGESVADMETSTDIDDFV